MEKISLRLFPGEGFFRFHIFYSFSTGWEECIRHSSIFCSYFALRVAMESVATAQLTCAN